MKVMIPSPLYDYTGGDYEVDVDASNLAGLMTELERRYPGIRFRMVNEQDALRGHMRIFINGVSVRDMNAVLKPQDEVFIVQALSGG
ncbi:MAG: MoaD/ThiS family protein [Gallionellaceae bacterium]|jgi:molybdopterin synthase sulfur carrier subunit